MKKIFFLLPCICAVPTTAYAQVELKSPAIQIGPPPVVQMKGNSRFLLFPPSKPTEPYRLVTVKADLRTSLTKLCELAGAKAFFDVNMVEATFDTQGVINGTLPDLINEIAQGSGLVVSQQDKEYHFTILQPVVEPPKLPFFRGPYVPFERRSNPVPPPNSRAFPFNGGLVYQVPLKP